jgi:hypothetical protein
VPVSFAGSDRVLYPSIVFVSNASYVVKLVLIPSLANLCYTLVDSSKYSGSHATHKSGHG